jgi:hypothetical protein
MKKQKKLRVILASKGKKLFFERENMKLEIDKAIDLNDYISFCAEAYTELVIAKYNLNKKRAKFVRNNVKFAPILN